jgi:uncharacterized protein (DUF58 family)
MARQTSTLTVLKPEQLAPIRNLNLRARLIVEGTIAGLHRSPYHGFSAEFLEYRPYFSGESTRFVDWRALARTDKTFVKLFEDETNLYAHILIDKSASMGFGGKDRMSKFDYARTLCASLAWILIRQRDAVGLCAFDEKIRAFLPPHATNTQLKNIIAALDTMKTSDKTQSGASINAVAATLKKRGLAVIISDLFDDPESIINGLRHLRFKRQDVILLWVADPLERDFRHDAPLRMRDLEQGDYLDLAPEVAAGHYQQGFAQHRGKIENACRELSISLEHILTTEPFQKALMRILRKREKLF